MIHINAHKVTYTVVSYNNKYQYMYNNIYILVYNL